MSKNNSYKITVGVAIVIERPSDGRVLVGVRGEGCSRGVGCWAFPGGRVDEGESFYQAIERECYEETHFFVDLPRYGYTVEETTIPFAVTMHQHLNHMSLWYHVSLHPSHDGGPLIVSGMEPDKCRKWHWLHPQDILAFEGTDDLRSEQYFWLPADVLRATLPIFTR